MKVSIVSKQSDVEQRQMLRVAEDAVWRVHDESRSLLLSLVNRVIIRLTKIKGEGWGPKIEFYVSVGDGKEEGIDFLWHQTRDGRVKGADPSAFTVDYWVDTMVNGTGNDKALEERITIFLAGQRLRHRMALGNIGGYDPQQAGLRAVPLFNDPSTRLHVVQAQRPVDWMTLVKMIKDSCSRFDLWIPSTVAALDQKMPVLSGLHRTVVYLDLALNGHAEAYRRVNCGHEDAAAIMADRNAVSVQGDDVPPRDLWVLVQERS